MNETWKINQYIILTYCNPLLCAIRDKDFERFQRELKESDINYQTPQGWTALMALARNSKDGLDMKIMMMEQLLKAGADPNLCNCFGWTVLIYASYYSETSSKNRIIELLLTYGSNPNMRSNFGYTAFTFASSQSNVELLLTYGGNPNTNYLAKRIYQQMRIRQARNAMATKMSIGFHLPADFYENIPIIS